MWRSVCDDLKTSNNWKANLNSADAATYYYCIDSVVILGHVLVYALLKGHANNTHETI